MTGDDVFWVHGPFPGAFEPQSPTPSVLLYNIVHLYVAYGLSQ